MYRAIFMKNFENYNREPNESQAFASAYFYNEQVKKNERKEIRKLSLFAGAAILSMILIQNGIVLLLSAVGLYSAYLHDPLFQVGVEMLISILSLLVPFSVFGAMMKKSSGIQEALPLGKPNDGKMLLLAIPAGLGICMIANRVTSSIIVMMGMFGFELSSPDIPMATGVFGVAASFFRVSICAALIEELCLRGFTMQNLRKYGDWFAIIMSAVVFGLMHANLVQAPFAMIAGIGLGYFSVKTNTLWTGVIIHSLNNVLSLAFSYFMDGAAEELFTVIYTFTVPFLTLIGLICLVIFVKKQKEKEAGLYPVQTANGFWAKTGAFLSSPTMLIAICLMLYFTSNFVTFSIS